MASEQGEWRPLLDRGELPPFQYGSCIRRSRALGGLTQVRPGGGYVSFPEERLCQLCPLMKQPREAEEVSLRSWLIRPGSLGL